MPADDLDRELPQKLAGTVFGIVLGVLFGLPLGWLLELRGLWLFLFVIVAMLAIASFIRRMATNVVNGTANAFLRLVWPTGESTPYARTYSSEQAMAARGDYEGAMVGYGAAMRLHPGDPEPRFQAAELLFRSPTPERAAPLFIEARKLCEGNRRELYATQRLIDLYLGPLDQKVKAFVELRRLVERFPGTREADAAHKVLNELKSELHQES